VGRVVSFYQVGMGDGVVGRGGCPACWTPGFEVAVRSSTGEGPHFRGIAVETLESRIGDRAAAHTGDTQRDLGLLLEEEEGVGKTLQKFYIASY
jgi:hypothetical protein